MNLMRIALVLLIGWLLGRWWRAKVAARGSSATDLVKCPKCQTYVAKGASHVCRPIAALLLLLLVPAQAHADQGGRYLVEVTGSNVIATLEVNGITAEKWTLGSNQTAGASFNHWLKQGNNNVVFRAVAAGNAASAVSARIYFLGFSANGTPHMVNLLESSDVAKLRLGTTISFNLSSAPRLALWQAQPPPAALTVPAAAALVGELRQQMASVVAVGGGMEDIKALEVERADLVRAFGGEAATSGSLVAALQNQQTGRVEISSPPVAGDLVMAPVGGTPLLRIARKDNTPLMAVRESGQVTAVPAIIVGWVGGAWRILRCAN